MQLRITTIDKKGKIFYQLRDENNHLTYVINRQSLIFNTKYQLVDEHHQELGIVKKSGKKYKIYDNKKFVDMAIPVKGPVVSTYELAKRKWTIISDITYTDYQIFDENKEKVATLNYNLPQGKWLISIRDKSDMQYLMLLVTAVVAMSQN